MLFCKFSSSFFQELKMLSLVWQLSHRSNNLLIILVPWIRFLFMWMGIGCAGKRIEFPSFFFAILYSLRFKA